MKSLLLFAVFVCTVTFGTVSSAHAALVSKLGGQVVYDTDLDVTWMTDALGPVVVTSAKR